MWKQAVRLPLSSPSPYLPLPGFKLKSPRLWSDELYCSAIGPGSHNVIENEKTFCKLVWLRAENRRWKSPWTGFFIPNESISSQNHFTHPGICLFHEVIQFSKPLHPTRNLFISWSHSVLKITSPTQEFVYFVKSISSQNHFTHPGIYSQIGCFNRSPVLEE